MERIANTRADDGAGLSYRIIGSGRRAIYLIHGWAVTGAVWDELAPLLDVEDRRLVIPDLRGTGRSDKPDTGYTIDRYVRDVLSIAAQEGDERFIVAGHSMGGLIAQGLAATATDRVSGLLLVCPVPASGVPLPQDEREGFLAAASKREAREAVMRMVTLAPAFVDRLTSLGDQIPAACLRESFLSWSRGAYAEQLDRIRVRTLVLATDDPGLQIGMLRERVAQRISGARLAHLPGAGHYPQLERARETAAVFEAFLA